MIIYCFSSEDFKPNRLYMSPNANKPHKLSFGDAPDGSKAERVSAEYTQKFFITTKTARNKTAIKIDKKQGYGKVLGRNSKQISGFVTANCSKTNWRECNKAFKKLLPETEQKDVTKHIMAMQRIIFNKFEINGDHDSYIDGKIGPFTLAAMAAYNKLKVSGLQVNLVTNKALKEVLRGIEEGGQTKVEKIANVNSLKILKGATVEGDGIFKLGEGNDAAYFKQFEDGWKWQSAGQRAKDKDDWYSVKGNYYLKGNKKDTSNEFNKIADSLAGKSAYFSQAYNVAKDFFFSSKGKKAADKQAKNPKEEPKEEPKEKSEEKLEADKEKKRRKALKARLPKIDDDSVDMLLGKLKGLESYTDEQIMLAADQADFSTIGKNDLLRSMQKREKQHIKLVSGLKIPMPDSLSEEAKADARKFESDVRSLMGKYPGLNYKTIEQIHKKFGKVPSKEQIQQLIVAETGLSEILNEEERTYLSEQVKKTPKEEPDKLARRMESRGDDIMYGKL